MTDTASQPTIREAVEARLKQRHRAEKRFQAYGLAAIGVAMLALATLVVSIVSQAAPAFTTYQLRLEMTLDPAAAAPGAAGAELESRAMQQAIRRGSYGSLLQDAMRDQFPALEDRAAVRSLLDLYTSLNAVTLMNRVMDNPGLIGERIAFTMPLGDDADRYMKGLVTPRRTLNPGGELAIVAQDEERVRIRMSPEAAENLLNAVKAETPQARFGPEDPSIIVRAFGGAMKITGMDNTLAEGPVLAPFDAASPAGWNALVLQEPQVQRQVSDIQAYFIEELKDRGVITRGLNTYLFTNTDSREPELAGVIGALAGSILTMLVTMLLAVPVGVFTAIYLEEYAPKTRWTEMIEVNINNLAAVPSIVFGLLGLAVFINFFGLPRSAPLVGGMVLALMTLPTVIISARAALKAVPPSIREAALGVGASKTQTVFHHVLPLAMPGILTGSIIGLAQALGETAPLLMIGMVAFVADVPGGVTEPSTVMPVQIYMWALNPERAWEARSAAAIIVLLTLMVLMNALAVFLRRRFERRW